MKDGGAEEIQARLRACCAFESSDDIPEFVHTDLWLLKCVFRFFYLYPISTNSFEGYTTTWSCQSIRPCYCHVI